MDPACSARLRQWEDWPRVDAIAITHWHLDHWGDVVPWVWAAQFGPASKLAAPELWVPPGGRDFLSELGERLGRPQMFELAFDVHEFERGTPFRTAGMEVTAVKVLHYGSRPTIASPAAARPPASRRGQRARTEVSRCALASDLFVR